MTAEDRRFVATMFENLGAAQQIAPVTLSSDELEKHTPSDCPRHGATAPGPTLPDRHDACNGRYRGAADGRHRLFLVRQKLALDRPWSACKSLDHL